MITEQTIAEERAAMRARTRPVDDPAEHLVAAARAEAHRHDGRAGAKAARAVAAAVEAAAAGATS